MPKWWWYLNQYVDRLVPKTWYRRRWPLWQAAIAHYMQEREFRERLAYYCQTMQSFPVGPDSEGFFSLSPSRQSAYFFDWRRIARYFPETGRYHVQFGDVNWEPLKPTLVKSRPVGGAPSRAVLLKLNSRRHFSFPSDPWPADSKSDTLVWRGRVKSGSIREKVMRQWFDEPGMDLGQTGRLDSQLPVVWQRGWLTVEQQLRHRFVLSVQGNDVATNLKWILASRSVAVMSEPSVETWLMEGRLVADKHYIRVGADYEDLAERLRFWRGRPEALNDMVRSANEWMSQFSNPHRETCLQMAVMARYLFLSGQAAEPAAPGRDSLKVKVQPKLPAIS